MNGRADSGHRRRSFIGAHYIPLLRRVPGAADRDIGLDRQER
jgi:hypothetical protein